MRAVRFHSLPVDGRLHEGVGDADRVVRVLVLDRGPVGRVERHVVARLLEDARLPLLLRLAPDELLDVRVVDVEHDHLRRAPRLAARLDRAGRRVGAAHEADRPGRVAALRELLLRGAQLREVEAGAGAAAEDDALAPDPVEDRLHRVVDREDEAGAEHCGFSSKPTLNQTGELKEAYWLTRIAFSSASNVSASSSVGEVAARPAPAADRVDDAADHLLDAALALGRAHAGRGSTSARRCSSPSATRSVGNSTFLCSKAGPSLPGMRASRSSHSISSNGSRPGIVKKRPERPTPSPRRRRS